MYRKPGDELEEGVADRPRSERVAGEGPGEPWSRSRALEIQPRFKKIPRCGIIRPPPLLLIGVETLLMLTRIVWRSLLALSWIAPLGAATAGPALAQNAAPLPGAVADPTGIGRIVTTAQGAVQGVEEGEMLAWLGIPYAAPPVDELRWQPPQPPAPWEGTRVANQVPQKCTQGPDLGFFATAGGSEDCLYLNVYADRQAVDQAQNGDEKLPVFVWLHGGGLQVGQGADYNPRALIEDGRAMVVTLNYRLGMFGFFAHPAIDAEGHANANYGQMDQTLALEWVQDNIAAFGGDPDSVTIAGESAGGFSVLAQVLSPWAAGLFHNAIEMSGAAMVLREPSPNGTLSLETAQARGTGFAEAVGCGDTKNAADCLRDLSIEEIMAHRQKFRVNMPVIDGDFLPDAPAALLRSGNFNRVPLISGTNRDEGDFFAALAETRTGEPLTAERYPEALEGMYGEKLSQTLLQQYPASNYLNAAGAFAAATTDYLFACPSLRLKELASQHTRVWGYRFADRTAPSYAPPVSFEMQAAHTFELPYLFPGFHGGTAEPTQLNPLQQPLAEQMQHYWTHVADADSWTDWPQYDTEGGRLLQLQLSGNRMMDSERYAEQHHCAFWDQQGVY